jgi:transposase-like protein
MVGRSRRLLLWSARVSFWLSIVVFTIAFYSGEVWSYAAFVALLFLSVGLRFAADRDNRLAQTFVDEVVGYSPVIAETDPWWKRSLKRVWKMLEYL